MREQVGCGWGPPGSPGRGLCSTVRTAVGAVCPDAALHAEGPLTPGRATCLGWTAGCVLRGVGVTSRGPACLWWPWTAGGTCPWVTSSVSR